MSGPSSNFEDDRADQIEIRLRALGSRTARCSHPGCVETDPFALTGVEPNILCREHAADAANRSWTEDHHPTGQHNAPETVEVPANDHGVLSEYQRLWSREILRNPDGSPLLRAAAATQGWLDVLRLMIERTVGWIPGELERLDRLLRDWIGERWWETIGWQP
jgi:hypothetical protein